MRIAPRTQLCASAWRIVASVADTGFDELRELCNAACDQVPLAIGMAGHLGTVHIHGDYRESSRLGTELVTLLKSTGDSTLAVGLLSTAINVKCLKGEAVEGMWLAQRLIDFAQGDSTKGNLMYGSPLAQALGVARAHRMFLGRPEWKLDFRRCAWQAWRAGAKGITVYRSGSRPGQVLRLPHSGEARSQVDVHGSYAGGPLAAGMPHAFE
jgi:adenylate cyclase